MATSSPAAAAESVGGAARWYFWVLRGLLLASFSGWGLILGLLVWQPFSPQEAESEGGYAPLGGATVEGWEATTVSEPSELSGGQITLHQLQAADALLLQGNAGQVIDFYARLRVDRRSSLHDQVAYRLAVARESLGDTETAGELFRVLAGATENDRLGLAARLGQARCYLSRQRPDLARALLARTASLLAPPGHGMDDLRADLFCMFALAFVPSQFSAAAEGDVFRDDRAVTLPPRWPAERLLALAHGRDPSGRLEADRAPGAVDALVSESIATTRATDGGDGQRPADSDMPREEGEPLVERTAPSEPLTSALDPRDVQIIYRYGPAPHEIQISVDLPAQSALPLLTTLCQSCGVPSEVSARAREVMTGRKATIRLDNVSLAMALDLVSQAVDVDWSWTGNTIQVGTRDEFEEKAWHLSAREAARRLLHFAVGNFPEHHLADSCYMSLGNLSFEDADFAQAAATYDQVVRLFPRSPAVIPCRFNRGKAFLRLDQRSEALSQFFSVADLAHGHPLHGPAYAYVGRLHLEGGDVGEATRPLMRAVAVSPADERSAIPVLLLSSAYLMAENPHAANEVLLQHRGLLASSSHQPLADFLASFSRYRAATEPIDAVHEGRDLVRSLSRLSPETFFGDHLLLLVGDALRSTGLTLKLQELYTTALQGTLSQWVSDRLRAELFHSMLDAGQRRQARQLLEESVRAASDPAAEQARLQLAQMDLEDGRLDDCLEAARTGVGEASSIAVKADFLRLMGRAYQARDHYHAAAICFAGMLPPHDSGPVTKPDAVDGNMLDSGVRVP